MHINKFFFLLVVLNYWILFLYKTEIINFYISGIVIYNIEYNKFYPKIKI